MPSPDWFIAANPIIQALVATLFTWGVTALGAGVVFLTGDVSRRLLDTALGFTAGVMIAASFWSLLAPAIALAEEMEMVKWVPALIGFLAGGAFLRVADRTLPHLHLFKPTTEAEGIPTKWRRSVLLVLAITLHNIPEGLAIGVAFGAVAAGYDGATIGSAIALALGARTGVRMIRMSAPVNTALKAVVNLLSRSRIKNRNRSARSSTSMNRLRAWWMTQAPTPKPPASCMSRPSGLVVAAEHRARSA